MRHIEDVKIVSSFKNKSKSYKKIQSRATHGFIYRLSGVCEYEINGEKIKTTAGDLIFLPKGSSYEFTSCESTYASINFEARIEDADFSVYSMNEYGGAHSLFHGFSEIWNFGNESDKFKCLSAFYDLLSYITRPDHFSSTEKGCYGVISAAIDYLKGHIYDTELKVTNLHTLCGVSDTYFRKIFKISFGITPQEYILKERLTHARLIIENGDYESIKSVAESVGYTDPLYFSKAFKKYFGFTPSSINE